LIAERELFVPFKQFPWFKDASISEIANVLLPSPHHLYWPDLDVDLAVDSLDHPERYPLVSKARPRKRAPSPRAQASTARRAPGARRRR
jgi:hypothetical protein